MEITGLGLIVLRVHWTSHCMQRGE